MKNLIETLYPSEFFAGIQEMQDSFSAIVVLMILLGLSVILLVVLLVDLSRELKEVKSHIADLERRWSIFSDCSVNLGRLTLNYEDIQEEQKNLSKRVDTVILDVCDCRGELKKFKEDYYKIAADFRLHEFCSGLDDEITRDINKRLQLVEENIKNITDKGDN